MLKTIFNLIQAYLFFVDFFEHTTPYNKTLQNTIMVITTHMYNQMIKENQNNEILENPDSKVIQSFLKDFDGLENTGKIISSNS